VILRRLLAVVLLALLAAAAAVAAGAEPTAPATEPVAAIHPAPYGPGELLVFSIDYGPVNAGEASLEVGEVIESGGHPCYPVESRAASNRFFSAFYLVRDKVVTHIDVSTLATRYFSKRLREGDYRQNVAIRYDQEAGKARHLDGHDEDVPFGVQDILSAFYFVRTLPLEPGEPARVVTHSSRKTYDLVVDVHGRETITVPAGTFDCIVVQPVIQGEGLFQFEGDLTIWLTDDARRLPVLMKTKVKVGAIDASLKSYRPGRPLNPEIRP
jgi:hypothetical protein